MEKTFCFVAGMLGVLAVSGACSLALFQDEPAGDADVASDADGDADADIAADGDADGDADVAADGDADGDADVEVVEDVPGDGEVGPYCGNGVVEPPEQCDDGNEVAADGCEDDCTWSCEASTECDDGEACNGAESCTDHACAAGVPPGEETLCTAGTDPGVCRAEVCVPIHCGNSLVDPGEACDDGNTDNTDGCLNDCTAARCGDGFVHHLVEECDGDPARSCTTSCTTIGSQPCTDCAWAACVPPGEICNGADDDCDSDTDEGFPCRRGASVSCMTRCGSTGTGTCSDACEIPPTASCTPPSETCNGVDDDCDTAVDEGCGPLVWVVNSALNAVQAVDPVVGGGVVATVPVGTNPHVLVFTPAGRELYVANQDADTVSVVDTATRTVTATIVVGPGPRAVAASPDGTRVYVACGARGGHTISVIGTATHAVADTFDTGLAASVLGVAVRPDGTQLWTTNDGYLKVFSLPSHTTVYTSGWTDGFVAGWAQFLPDGSVFWATSSCGCCGNVQRYSGSSYGQISDHRFGSPTTGLAMSRDGAAVYVGYWGADWGCSGSPYLVKLNGATNAVLLSVPLSKPFAGVVSADGATLYLTRQEDGLSVVDTSTLAVLRTFPLGGIAEAAALRP
jgi:YVTN family beta-propeller protein/cysteine-rich repeat protein